MGLLALIRHGYCVKNAEKRHGGIGSPLTEVGRHEASARAAQLARKGISPAVIFTVERLQCAETAAIIADKLGGIPLVPLAFEPYFLGVLSGLSEEECAQRYPQLAQAMTRYRRGEIEIAEVNIPKASDPIAFVHAAQVTLGELVSRLQSQDVIVVGTRSVLVGLLNVALGHSPVVGGGYYEIPWSNCGCCILSPSLEVKEVDGVTI
jgi:2,3-bisphosphoglycerate-dependent phosphoglycerate mutase